MVKSYGADLESAAKSFTIIQKEGNLLGCKLFLKENYFISAVLYIWRYIFKFRNG